MVTINKGIPARLLVALLSVGIGVAQQPLPVNYIRADFIKAKPGKLSEYEAFLKKNLPLVIQAQVKDGKMLGFAYTRVVTPTGSAEEHDLIGLYTYEKWDQLEPQEEPADSVKAAMKSLGFATPEEYAMKRDPLRDIVRSEIWHYAAGTTGTVATTPKVGEYLVVAYLKVAPGKQADYLDVWKKYSLPVQEERVKDGKIKSYSMWTVAGGGTGANYDLVSLVRYAAFRDIQPDSGATAETNAYSERIHAGKDWRQMQREMVALRSVYRSEIVKIADRIH